MAKVGYDVILGKPWLAKHNPEINWRTNKVSIGDYTWLGKTVCKFPGFLLSAVQFARATRVEAVEVFAAFVRFDDAGTHPVKIESL